MKYRKFGRLNWKSSALGFGAMRLPFFGNETGNIDKLESIKMIRYAIDHGINYIDTAYPYHQGKSELLVGKALEDGYREKVKLATKMPTWLVNSQDDMDKFLEEQLSKLQTNQIDFYLLHGLRKDRWNILKALKVIDWAEKKIGDGKFEYLGFSFHDDYNAFKKIVDGYEGWALCQIQYNYMDADYQAGTTGLKYAASKGLAVVVMEPLAGGKLAINPPEEVQEIWDKAEIKKSPAELALHWVWNHQEVSVALSGMSTMQQVIENVESAERSGPRTLTKNELQVVERVKMKYREFGFIGCTGCGYCIPCPEGVNIPVIFGCYNEYFMKDRESSLKEKYLKQVTPDTQAKRCVRCSKCEELCPQRLPIKKLLRSAVYIFESED